VLQILDLRHITPDQIKFLFEISAYWAAGDYNAVVRGQGVYRILYVVFALGTAHLALLCGVELQRYFAQEQQLQLVEAQTKAIAAEVASIRQELVWADSPDYLEEKARSLGYVFPNEVLHAKPR